MIATQLLALLLALPVVATQGSPARRVGGAITDPVKIRNAIPGYPTRLKQAGVQDIVFVDAVIDEEGAVVDVTPLRGIPELMKPTVAAVRQWRYRPATLNGEPVRVVMTVSVAFFVAGRPRLPVMAAALRDPNEQVRIRTIHYLSVAHLDKAKVLALLERAQSDDAPAVRAAASVAISRVEARPE